MKWELVNGDLDSLTTVKTMLDITVVKFSTWYIPVKVTVIGSGREYTVSVETVREIVIIKLIFDECVVFLDKNVNENGQIILKFEELL